ncbi:ABC transporter ATP-binding protein [Philodulcilactobacillus myokoensis]|uniref:ABC transporter ATP-binding protein n=1 Tax=Philodulcilactobacillus myokoensis TaxID=2929573 RepID=A0A9W6B2R0_9LACO|nr:ABC transporter ATP-binding protein/permease [Philodulcilactobacillus myokoensis]GLB47293.1 ABC transporter ATP-binding protein [Philodulcilactobacillus myokoensis]
MAFLSLKHIHKSYHLNGEPDFKVLKGIDLDFNKGEFVSILGESGGGKTTLMNIIGGLDSNYSGDVYLNGKSLKHDTTKQLDNYRRQTIGFVFQNFHLIGHLTVLDNVMVSLEMTNLSHRKQVKRAKELLDRVGLKEHIHKYPNQLSGGQQQRVAIARALASDPSVIIADEPTGALDATNTDEILKLLDSIAQEGKLVITVTHSQKVADYGTRIVHMQDGVIDSDKRIKEPYKANNSRLVASKPLSFGNTIKMTLKQMKYNLGRNILITIGGAIGIFSVILMLGLGNGVKGYMNHEIFSQANPSAIQVQKNKGSLNDNDFKRLKNVKGVEKVEKVVDTDGTVQNGKQNLKENLMTYSSVFKDSNIKAGHKPGNNEIIISKDVASKLNKKHPYDIVGKTYQVKVMGVNKQHQPVTMLKSLKVSGVMGTGNMFFNTTGTISTNYNTANQMYQSHHLTAQSPYYVAKSSGDISNVSPVQDRITSLKTGKKQTYAAQGIGTMAKTLNTYVNVAVDILASIAAISLLVSAIMIIVVMYISVSERTKEIGILRALGVTKHNVRLLFISESFFLGLFSAIFAEIIAFLVQGGINGAFNGMIHYNIANISMSNAIFGLAVAIIINILAALIPAAKGARLDPVESMSK